MVPQWIIEKKRDGEALAEEEIRGFIAGYARGDIPDYQMAALAMAIYFRGMSFDETSALTRAMMDSGRTVDTSGLAMPTADKHSTGGIGDKVSLVLAPLVACCGLAVPMMSGRGLGITGGTLDKLESIPGYRTDLSIEAFMDVLSQCGCSIIGQTADLAPADKKLYALRDVTGTVPSVPLIAASIMSKKLAEGAGALVLDVKWGSGAFMQSLEQARELARTMVAIGRRMGQAVSALITDMHQPLGCTAGNAVEVVETIEALRGNGPADLMAVTLELAAEMLVLTGRAPSRAAARPRLEECIRSGAALKRFAQMVALHGGDAAVIEHPEMLSSAPVRRELTAPDSGYVARVDAGAVGRACLLLGAGRRRVEDTVTHSVGVTGLRKIGERVERGACLAVLHAANEADCGEAERALREAFRIEADAVEPPALIVQSAGTEEHA